MAGSRPLIGLTTYHDEARWGVWDEPAVLLPAKYVRSVTAAGGIPVLLPSMVEDLDAVIGRLDGLILTGGTDIDPGRYGAEPLLTTGAPRPDRDAAELALVSAAAAAGTPVLGICRGVQMINVARGGTLIQHLPDGLNSADHAPAPAVYGHHPVRVSSGSLLAKVLGRAELEVASYHHQGIDQVGTGLTVTALAPDGTIEALEDESLPFFIGVLWHPEVGEDLSLFTALVAACR
jgi:putative glutamine amidotransferase